MPLKEVKIPNLPQVYKLVEISENGKERPTGNFRVRKRCKAEGKWTTHTQTFDSFDDARRFAKTPYTPQPIKRNQKVVFSQVFARFMAHKERELKLARGTLAGYWNRYVHLKFFDPIEMNQIGPKTIDAWISLLLDPEYLKHQQGSRINYDHEYTLLSGIFRYYRNYEDETFVIPLLDRHRRRACARSRSDDYEIRFLNTQEEMEFLEKLQPKNVMHDLALFQLHTGARVGEVAALEFRNIDFLRNEVRITQHLHWERKKPCRIFLVPGTKTGPARSVPLTRECLAMLRRRKLTMTSGKVFEGSSPEGWLYYRTIQCIYDQAFKSLNLPHRGTHTLRHTFAVRFLDQTKDIYALQQLLGHTDLKVTQVYAKYSNESVRRSFQLFKGGLDENPEGVVPQLVPREIQN